MIDVKKIELADCRFMGISLDLPMYPLQLIVSTHVILASDAFSLDHFNDRNKKTAVILCTCHRGFEDMLACEVKAMNDMAVNAGVTYKMKAREALLLCEKSKEKSR